MALRRWRNLKIDGNSIPIIDDPPQGSGDYGTQFFTTIIDDRRGKTIGWTFDKPYICDKFINGDWWVYAPDGCTVVQTTPVRNETTKAHGSCIDWRPEKNQCWAGNIMGMVTGNNGPLMFAEPPPAYDETHLARVPISLSPGQTLLTGRCVDDPNDIPDKSADVNNKQFQCLRPQVWKIGYLTVVDEIPAQYSFRPPYIGGAPKKVAAGGTRFWNRTDYLARLSTLPKLAPVPSANPSEAFLEVEMPRWWGWGWIPGGTPRIAGSYTAFIAPWHNTHWYGRDRNTKPGIAGIHTCFNYPDAVKEPIVYSLIQDGIDAYATVVDGGWNGGLGKGGQTQGYDFPILFAGLMLDHAPYKEFITGATQQQKQWRSIMFNQSIPLPANKQHLYSSHSWGQKYPWADGYVFGECRGSTPDDPNYLQTGLDSIPGGGADYGLCCTLNSNMGVLIASLMLGIEDWWGDPETIYKLHDWNSSRGELEGWQRFWKPLFRETWLAYRNNYPPVYHQPFPG